MIFYCLLADEMQYCSNKQDINIISWWTGEMILVDWSHLTRWHEMNGQERPKVMDAEMGDGGRRGQRYAWRRRQEWWRTEGWFYSRKQWRWQWGGVGGGYRKRAVTTEFDCCLCYAILESVTASTDGVGGREGRAYKSMSWSTSSRERAKLGRLDSEPPLLLREWPPETGRERRRRGGKQKERREAEERGRRGGRHNKQRQQ